MTFDPEGHFRLSPRKLFQLAKEAPQQLIDRFLIPATPAAFATYEPFCDFLLELSLRTAVHPRNLFLRGSCQVGFSIAPKAEKVWMAMDAQSDLDLAIVDASYYERIDREVFRWEERTRAEQGWGPAAHRFDTRTR